MKRINSYFDLSNQHMDQLAKLVTHKFIFINNIELELDVLIKELAKAPSIEKYRTIKNKVDLARQLSDTLMKLTSQTNVPKHLKDGLLGNLVSMIDAINIINANAQEIAEQIPAPQRIENPLHEQMLLLLPSISSYVTLTSFQLREALSQGEIINENELQKIMDINAKKLSAQLYSAEEDSIAVKKLEGLSRHYLQIAQNYESLYQESIQFKEQNQQLQNSINSLQALNVSEKKANEITKKQIQQLQNELQKNKREGHYGSVEVNKLIKDNNNYKKDIAELRDKLKAIEGAMDNEQNNRKPSHAFFRGFK